MERLDLEQPCCHADVLHIPAFENYVLVVREEGLPERTLTVPVGMRICELKQKISFHPQSDLTPLKSRRKIKHREVLCLVRKKSLPEKEKG